jgi:hypothetical protein
MNATPASGCPTPLATLVTVVFAVSMDFNIRTMITLKQSTRPLHHCRQGGRLARNLRQFNLAMRILTRLLPLDVEVRSRRRGWWRLQAR